jgi:hypothetical protein
MWFFNIMLIITKKITFDHWNEINIMQFKLFLLLHDERSSKVHSFYILPCLQYDLTSLVCTLVSTTQFRIVCFIFDWYYNNVSFTILLLSLISFSFLKYIVFLTSWWWRSTLQTKQINTIFKLKQIEFRS